MRFGLANRLSHAHPGSGAGPDSPIGTGPGPPHTPATGSKALTNRGG